MAEAETDVREEYFENEPTGVETEPENDQSSPVRPWDPSDIRVSTKQFSLRNILDLIDDGDLELAPDFQRNQVWKARQKSRLIESVLLQIPLPAFYFAEDTDGMMRVVDGLQRLSTVHSFVRGGVQPFALRDLEYLDIDGKRFVELSPALQRRIHNAQIVVHVIDPTTPAGVKYDVFKRINTGGTPLNAQEIRHCMSRNRSREFLKRCIHTPAFDIVTGGRFRDHIRMDDREVVLRFCAFWLRGVEGYLREGSMDAFLETTTAMLDDPEQIPDARLEEVHSAFNNAMSNSWLVFGTHAFRKWPLSSSRSNPINRPLFECWSYVLSSYDADDLEARKTHVVRSARELMTLDQGYLDSITTSTGDPRNVRFRFEQTKLAAEAGR
jgi:hypothetical protein